MTHQLRHRVLLLLSCVLPFIGSSQTLDPIVDVAIDNFSYGKDYCSCIDSLIQIAQINDYKDEVKELYGLKAFCFSPSSEKDSMAYFLSKVSLGASPRALGLSASIEAYLLQGNEEDELAIQQFVKAIELFDPDRDAELITLTQLAIGWAYYSIFSFDLSMKYGYIGLANAKKDKNQYNTIEGLDILANSYLRLGDSILSDSFFKEYLTIAKGIDNPTVSYWANTTAGHNFVSSSKHDSAHFFFQKSYDSSLALGDSSLQLEALLYLGENAQMNNDNESAILYLTKAESMPDKYHRSALDRRINEYLALAYSSQENYTSAYYYLNKYKDIDDEHWNQESREIALDFEAKYQSVLKDAELSAKELQLNRSNSQRSFLLIGLASLLSLLWFLAHINRKNKLLSASKIDNLEKQQKLIALDNMVQGQEHERKRIAQDLHDGLGGLLSSAHIQIQNVQKEIEKLSELQLLDKAETMIDDACTEVRRISHDMMPGALIELGLIDAVEDFIDKVKSKNTLRVTLIDKTDNLDLTGILKVQLYRVIQEVMNNVIKHAKASSINLSFNITDKGLLNIEIKDDGIGFDYENAIEYGGLGLKNIESRIKYINGKLSVLSNKEDGTHYSITIPLEK